MDIDSLRMIADGRIFTGRQAWEYGLVDSLGSYIDVVDYVRSEQGLSEDTKVIEKKKREFSWYDLLPTEVFGDIVGFTRVRPPSGLYFLSKYF
jgi:protease-4